MAETALKTAALLLTSIVTAVVCTEEQCPPWFLLENSTSSSQFPQCVCSDILPYFIKCNQREQTSYLKLGHCAFQHSTTNDTMVAPCPFVFPTDLIQNWFMRLPKNKSELNPLMCESLNREVGEDTCGKCKNGTGPNVYSAGSQCTNCSAWNIAYYLLLRYLPTTILFVLVLLFRISMTSAPMAHYVLFCNALTMYFKLPVGLYTTFGFRHNIHAHAVIRAFMSLNSIWSFDPLFYVSPALCISPHITEIDIYFIDTLATLYPFSLLLLTYVGIELHARDCRPVVVLWRPFFKISVRLRKSWDRNASVIEAFASLLFLSYTKFVILAYEPLMLSKFVNATGHSVLSVVYIDPTIKFFSYKHYYIIILSALIFTLIVIPPIILMIIIPTRLFKKIHRFLKPRWGISLTIFVDTFQGCYKDGTSNGTRDYRAISGYLLAMCTLLPALLIGTFFRLSIDLVLAWQVAIIFLIALTVACAVLRPYKSSAANASGVVVLSLMAILCTLSFSYDNSSSNTATVVLITGLLLSTPHLVFYSYIAFRLAKNLKPRIVLYIKMVRGRRESDEELLISRQESITNYSHLSQVSS